MATLRLYVLGPPLVEIDGAPVKVHTRKALALLIYLCVTHQEHRRDTLADLLWPESGHAGGRLLLRGALHSLRRGLGVDLFEADRESIRIGSEVDLWVDVGRFHGLLAECEAHGHRLEDVCRSSLEAMREAVELCRGGFLAGFSVKGSSDFDDWQSSITQSLHARVDTAYQRLLRSLKGENNWSEALVYAQRWLLLDRVNESAHRYLMELYALLGQRTAALKQYRDCAAILRAELGAGPELSTVELFESIRDNRFRAAEAAPAAEADYPAKNNLPHIPTRFIGREREISELRRLLSSTRLLTVTGSGGSGKTRIALQAASTVLAGYRDGVWLVEMAALTHPSQVVQAVAVALGIRDAPGLPKPAMHALQTNLRSKELLLVLDDCEHLIRGCAELAGSLLRTCRNLRILATSREHLGIAGETTWRLPSLPCPDRWAPGSIDNADLSRYDAVRLFVDRAKSALPSFSITDGNAPAVAEVCIRLDGIPLAIELAATKVNALTVEQIRDRLHGHFHLLTGGSRTSLPRHRTLRATLDWSYGLLSRLEMILLTRLSVFTGGWTLEAAEEVCSDRGRESKGQTRITPSNVLDTLSHLVDKSMVIARSSGTGRNVTGCWRRSGSMPVRNWRRPEKQRPCPAVTGTGT